MHIGVIGAGGMGARHIENLRSIEGIEVTITDVDLARASEVARPASAVTDDPYLLIADPSIVGIVIASPDHTHADYAIACIEAGKRVLVEKPVAETTHDAQLVMETEAATGRRLVQVGFMREFDPEHQELRTEIERGAVGRPMLIRCTHANVGVGVPPVDAFIRSAIHDLHTLRFMTNQEIREVMVHTLPAEEGDRLIRLATITCRLDSVLGNITLNMAAGYGYDVQVEVTGERGVVGTEGIRERPLSGKGGKTESFPAHWLDRFQAAYLSEIETWITSLSGPEAVGPSAWDGYATVAAANACIVSAQTRQPVRVDLIARPIVS